VLRGRRLDKFWTVIRGKPKNIEYIDKLSARRNLWVWVIYGESNELKAVAVAGYFLRGAIFFFSFSGG